MSGGRNETDTETLDIIEGVVERVHFEFAAVAGSGIDGADRQAVAEPSAGSLVD
jgi:hypothetical protein